MNDRPINPPLEPFPDQPPISAHVIDLAGMRLRLGMAKRVPNACSHQQLIYCELERRVWCEACDKAVDNFDALMVLTKHLKSMLTEARRKISNANEALAALVTRRAAKVLDREWAKGMAVDCPHCRCGILPEDFADGSLSARSRELEIARRRKT